MKPSSNIDAESIQQAVTQVVKHGCLISEVSQQFGIGKRKLLNCVKRYESNTQVDSYADNANLLLQISDLRRKINNIEQENSLLKKENQLLKNTLKTHG